MANQKADDFGLFWFSCFASFFSFLEFYVIFWQTRGPCFNVEFLELFQWHCTWLYTNTILQGDGRTAQVMWPMTSASSATSIQLTNNHGRVAANVKMSVLIQEQLWEPFFVNQMYNITSRSGKIKTSMVNLIFHWFLQGADLVHHWFWQFYWICTLHQSTELEYLAVGLCTKGW